MECIFQIISSAITYVTENTVLTSLMVAVVTAFVTDRLNRRTEEKRSLHEKRAELYSTVYPEAERFLNDQYLAFDVEFYNLIVSYHAKMKLLASPKTYNAFRDFGSLLHEKVFSFREYYKQNKSHNSSMQTSKNFGFDCITDNFDVTFTDEIKQYLKSNLPSHDEAKTLVAALFNAMQADLGCKK